MDSVEEAVISGTIDRIGVLPAGERNSRPFSGTVGASDTLDVEGWAINTRIPFVAGGVVLTLGEASSVTDYGGRRLDVAAAYGNAVFTDCGFRGVIAPRPGAVGVQQLRIFAVGPEGNGLYPIGNAVQMTVVPATMRAFSSAPLRVGFALHCVDRGDGERIRRGETLHVAGWAYDRLAPGPVRGVFLVVDNADVIYGSVGLSRPDVAASLGNDAFSSSGFLIRFDTSGLTVGLHYLRIGFIAHDGGAQESFGLMRGLGICL